MAKPADAPGLGPGPERGGGSSPLVRTTGGPATGTDAGAGRPEPFLHTFAVLDAEHCGQVVAALRREEDGWHAGQVGPRTAASVRPARAVAVRPASSVPVVAETVSRLDEFLATRPAVRDGRLQRGPVTLLRYGIGQRYAAHRDHGPGHPDRVLSCLLYLNDDFRGGATRFPVIARRVVPRAGTVVLFGARLLHEAEPVLEGEKYALVCWLSPSAGRTTGS